MLRSLTGIKRDVVAAVSRFQPTRHVFQNCNLAADHSVWFGYVNIHIRVRNLIGQSISNDNRLVPVLNPNASFILFTKSPKCFRMFQMKLKYSICGFVIPAFRRSIPTVISRCDPLTCTERVWQCGPELLCMF